MYLADELRSKMLDLVRCDSMIPLKNVMTTRESTSSAKKFTTVFPTCSLHELNKAIFYKKNVIIGQSSVKNGHS